MRARAEQVTQIVKTEQGKNEESSRDDYSVRDASRRGGEGPLSVCVRTYRAARSFEVEQTLEEAKQRAWANTLLGGRSFRSGALSPCI